MCFKSVQDSQIAQLPAYCGFAKEISRQIINPYGKQDWTHYAALDQQVFDIIPLQNTSTRTQADSGSLVTK